MINRRSGMSEWLEVLVYERTRGTMCTLLYSVPRISHKQAVAKCSEVQYCTVTTGGIEQSCGSFTRIEILSRIIIYTSHSQ